MKKNINYFSILVFAAIIFIGACKEEPPFINHEIPHVSSVKTYIVSPVPPAELKQVLIEDVSGISCANCPEAADIAHSIVVASAALNPSRKINVVTIIPDYKIGNLTDPLDHLGVVSKYDFRTIAATKVVNFVRGGINLPAGYIDRNVFSGDRYVDKTYWSGDVTSELATVNAPMNIEITPAYSSVSNTLNVVVKVTYTQALNDTNYLHVMLLQDSVTDAQESKDNGATIYDSAYVHNHSLMDMLSSFTGDLLNDSASKTLVPGRVFEITYNYTLNPRSNSVTTGLRPPMVPWDTKHLSVLAFVSQSATTKYVLQSKKVDVP